MDKKTILEGYGITLFERDGKFYWTIKSTSFDSCDEAYKDATMFCKASSKPTKPVIHQKVAHHEMDGPCLPSQDLHSL